MQSRLALFAQQTDDQPPWHVPGGPAMFQWLNQLVIRISTSGWLFIATTGVFVGSLSALLRIGDAFPAHAGGAQPFDLQNGLTTDQVLPQLAGYTDRACELYYLFTAIDYVFPLAAGLFLGAAGAFALRHGLPGVYATLARRGLFPLFLIGSGFDWCENVAALTATLSYPDVPGTIPALLVTAKRLKLGFVMLTQGTVAVLLLIALGSWLRKRLRQS
jgi:hypothetical protein